VYWNFTDILAHPQDEPFTRSIGTIIVEIGFGNGEYIGHLARSNAEALVVGIELSQWCIAKAARRALADGLGNVRLLLGDARYLLRYAFEPGCVSEVYMNFPCPWPKRRHASRRVARPQFAALICQCLRPGGFFKLATDVEWYARETMEAFASEGHFDAAPVERNPEREYATKYERKWREMGRDTYMAAARKIKDAEPCEQREEERQFMASETDRCQAAGDLRDRLSGVEGERIAGDGYIVMFREIFFSDGGSALISVISVDEGFEQHYRILAVTTRGKEIRGKVDAIGRPYRTPGVRASLRYLAQKTGVIF
jgi:tRNA (guanine-N7-)-methyltransferase